MAELADAQNLGFCVLIGRAGSTPAAGTIFLFRVITMKPEQLKASINDLVEECIETIESKNHDYTGDDTDALANFKLCEYQGLCSAEKAILIRLSDKMQRLTTFAEKGELEVDNESVQDAIMDSINYLLFLNAVIEEKAMSTVHAEPEDPADVSPGLTDGE